MVALTADEETDYLHKFGIRDGLIQPQQTRLVTITGDSDHNDKDVGGGPHIILFVFCCHVEFRFRFRGQKLMHSCCLISDPPTPQIRCVRKHQLRCTIRRENKQAGWLVCDGHYIATFHIFSIADTYQHSTFVILLAGRGVQIGRVFAYFYFLT